MKRLTACPLLLFILWGCQKNDTPSATEPEPQLKVDSTTLSLNGTSKAVDSFTVQYSGKWHITTNPSPLSWLRLSATTGTGTTKVYVSVQESNSSTMSRTATLTVVADENPAHGANLVVTQKPYEFVPWRNVFGGSENDEFAAVQPTTDGGFVAVGSTTSQNGDVTTNHGKMDLWVVKVDAEGSLLWQKTYGGSEVDSGNDIVATTDGGYLIVGRTASSNGDVTNFHGAEDVWVLKLDGAGNKVWQKTFGGTGYEQAFSVINTTDGGYFLGATTSSGDGDVSGYHTLPGYSGQGDAWLLKLDAVGNLQWQRAYGGTNSEAAFSVIQTSDGGYIAAGWSDASQANGDVQPTMGSIDCWVFKVDAMGKLVWQKGFGGSEPELARTVIPTPDGGCIVAGFTNSANGDVSGQHGDSDGWVVKLDAGGNKQWQKTLGGSGDDAAYCVIPASGGYLVAGQTASTDANVSGLHGLSDGWLIKLDNNGSILWQKTYGGSDNERFHFVVASGSGTYLLAGATRSTDGDAVGIHGKEDAWLIRMKE